MSNKTGDAVEDLPQCMEPGLHGSLNDGNGAKTQIDGQSPMSYGPAESHDDSEPDDDPEPDGLEFIEPAESDDGRGLDCELHVYETRLDTRGEEVTLRVGVKEDLEPDRDKSHHAALVLTREYDEWKELTKTTLAIRSPHLIKAFKDVIESYPGVYLGGSRSVLLEDNDVWCLFHYRLELESYAKSSDNIQLQSHMSLCLQYMVRTFEKQITRFNSTVEGRQRDASLDFKNLWMAYKPGDLLYTKFLDTEAVVALDYMFLYREGQPRERWMLQIKRLTCDGTQLGYGCEEVALWKYDGVRELSTLEIFPLCYHPEKSRIEDQLTERGKKFVTMTSIRHCQYRGVARLSRHNNPTTVSRDLVPTTVSVPNYPKCKSISHLKKIRQRVIVDPEEFYRNSVGSPTLFDSSKDVLGDVSSTIDISDRDFLICNHEVPAYTLTSKLWGLFKVQDIEAVELNEDAFTNLVLAEEKKKMLHALIMSRSLEGPRLDDFIAGKGKGLVILVHGPPGVGKTFTAEAMAECARVPLLSVNAGEFIGPAPWVEKRLDSILRLSTRWKALLLLDEADVFMQSRNLRDLERNGLVSVLLRTLEYFEGTLFLTTNRVETIDTAFMSRIHLAVSYPPLSEEAKRQLWKTWIERTCQERNPHWMSSQLLDSISRLDVNGQNIKNTALLAESLAKSDHRPMRASDILQGVAAITQFQEEFHAIAPQLSAANQAMDGNGDDSIVQLSWLKSLWWYWRS